MTLTFDCDCYRFLYNSLNPRLIVGQISSCLTIQSYCDGFLSDQGISFSVSDLLIESLFKTNVRLNPEHKSKYIYLLSYAASVTETYKKV